jgi:hypothetical protein
MNERSAGSMAISAAVPARSRNYPEDATSFERIRLASDAGQQIMPSVSENVDASGSRPEESSMTPPSTLDFSDQASRRALSAAAQALAPALGRQAARAYFAQLLIESRRR